MASPSSSSSSSSPIHPASLIDRNCHSPALLELVELKVSQQVYNYTIDRVIETVDYAMRKSTASSSRGRAFNKRKPEHVKFAGFVKDVLSRAEVTMPTLLATLVYIDRARPQLHIGLEQWALERVFLGALIVASKYLNDSTLKNVHWAMCTGVFGKRDVGRIEREYLDVLGFELKLSESDLLEHEQGIIAAITESPSSATTSSPIAFPTKSLPSTPATATATATAVVVVSPPPTPKRERQISYPELAYPTPPASAATTTTTSMAHYAYQQHQQQYTAERRHKRRRLPSPVATAAAVAAAVAVAPSSSSSSRTSSSSSPPDLSNSPDSDSDSSDSESSLSPRTPPEMGMDVDPASPVKAHQQHKFQPRKMMNLKHGFSTMDLLRSFPIPRMSTS